MTAKQTPAKTVWLSVTAPKLLCYEIWRGYCIQNIYPNRPLLALGRRIQKQINASGLHTSYFPLHARSRCSTWSLPQNFSPSWRHSALRPMQHRLRAGAHVGLLSQQSRDSCNNLSNSNMTGTSKENRNYLLNLQRWPDPNSIRSVGIFHYNK